MAHYHGLLPPKGLKNMVRREWKGGKHLRDNTIMAGKEEKRKLVVEQDSSKNKRKRRKLTGDGKNMKM